MTNTVLAGASRVFLASIAIASAAPAQNSNGFAWRENDKVAVPDRSRASSNGFGAMMMVTPDFEGFWKAWEGPTPPQVVTTDKAELDKPVHAMLIFSGCKPKPDGRCDIIAEFSMLGPDGKPYGEPVGGKAWTEAPAPNYSLQLSEASLGFRLEPQDLAGPYLLRASVTDTVAGVSLQVEQTVTGVK